MHAADDLFRSVAQQIFIDKSVLYEFRMAVMGGGTLQGSAYKALNILLLVSSLLVN